MNSNSRLGRPELAVGGTHSDDAVIWLHPAFCSLALPMRASRDAWRRKTGTASVSIEAGAGDGIVPSGRIVRLTMMYICNAAFRTNSPVVDLSENAVQFAARLGVDAQTHDLMEQCLRVQAARMLVAWNGGAELSVFDTRGRPRGGGPEWRSSIRLNNRFLASLAELAVPLDQRVVRELSASPAALDAYAWIRLSLRHATADQIVTASWDELLQRFGTGSEDVETFRAAYEVSLRVVFDAGRSIALAVDDDGVKVRHAPREVDTVAPDRAAPARRSDETGESAAPGRAELMPVTPVADTGRNSEDSARRSGSRLAGQTGPIDALPGPEDRITHHSISLPRELTGLTQVIWLRRGNGDESVLVGVTPAMRFDADRLTVLAVEPMVVQVSGGLNEQEFVRVSSWIMNNRDVIDDFWEGRITSFAEIRRRVRKAPAPGWR